MANQKTDHRIPATLATILIVSAVLLLSVWAFAATILNSRQLPTEQTLKGSHGKRKVQHPSV